MLLTTLPTSGIIPTMVYMVYQFNIRAYPEYYAIVGKRVYWLVAELEDWILVKESEYLRSYLVDNIIPYLTKLSPLECVLLDIPNVPSSNTP
jgi:hypothetical protein